MNYDALSASDGAGEPVRITLTADRSIGSTTLTGNTPTNWPTGTFIATTGTLQSDGTLDPTTVQVFYGTSNGTTITITSFAAGYSDLGSSIGDVVVIKPTTEWANIIGSIIGAPMNLRQASTGLDAILQAAGSDANININLVPKGTGIIKFNGMGAWQSWTPTWGGLSSPTVDFCTYTQIGKTVFFKFHITLTGTVSGAITFTLPVTANSKTTGQLNIASGFGEHGGGGYFQLGASTSGTSTATVTFLIPSGTNGSSSTGSLAYNTTSASTPISAWASGDSLALTGFYEAA